MATLATANTRLNFSVLLKPFAAVGKFLVTLAEQDARMKALRALMAMTDEELAERGLKREDIVQHVFADKYYI
ncbi:DUF1127 domain-containing protein [Epibacterium sp. SM1979]|uniref:DUF1127 domain-containing protein n=1 Tax=Tritonibacter litoralis TaxID=2662264 RepID=A0A843YLZ4_9RHOB|nr:DUF1127 domain-containing protein [Tritonibacter litoralis]MQQ10209.1 DUF1127 domain-containing protein [Tritonibacter litoralis]